MGISSNIFWSSAKPDPKRQFRFIVEFPQTPGLGGKIPQFVVKTASKPKITISSTPHVFMDHQFNFPGRVTWDPVTITMVDPAGSDDIAVMLMNKLGASGYKNPTTGEAAVISLSKDNSVNKALGEVSISQLNAEGLLVEKWTLKNAFITNMDFGGLDYSSDELSEISIELTYDWATLNENPGRTTATPWSAPTGLD
jgi:hypothetical protein